MPAWALPIIKWVGERFLHTFIYGVIILGAGFFLYSAFLKPTNSQRTVIQDGGKASYFWQGASISPHFGGCVTIKAEKPREIK